MRSSSSSSSCSSSDCRVVADPYGWPHNGSLSPETTALVIIDMQRDCKGPHSHPHVVITQT